MWVCSETVEYVGLLIGRQKQRLISWDIGRLVISEVAGLAGLVVELGGQVGKADRYVKR